MSWPVTRMALPGTGNRDTSVGTGWPNLQGEGGGAVTRMMALPGREGRDLGEDGITKPAGEGGAAEVASG